MGLQIERRGIESGTSKTIELRVRRVTRFPRNDDWLTGATSQPFRVSIEPSTRKVGAGFENRATFAGPFSTSVRRRSDLIARRHSDERMPSPGTRGNVKPLHGSTCRTVFSNLRPREVSKVTVPMEFHSNPSPCLAIDARPIETFLGRVFARAPLPAQCFPTLGNIEAPGEMETTCSHRR